MQNTVIDEPNNKSTKMSTNSKLSANSTNGLLYSKFKAGTENWNLKPTM